MKQSSFIPIHPDRAKLAPFFDPLPAYLAADPVEVPGKVYNEIGMLLHEFGIYDSPSLDSWRFVAVILIEEVYRYNQRRRKPGKAGRPIRFPSLFRHPFKTKVTEFLRSGPWLEDAAPGQVALFIGSLFAVCGFLQSRPQFRRAEVSSYRNYLIRSVNKVK